MSARWLKLALIVSVAVNLLFVGAGIARFIVGDMPQRFARGASQVQIIPRKFFAELDRSRRMELLAVFKGHDKDFRDGRRAVRDQLSVLADALDADPYDPQRVTAAVAGFTARSEALVGTGGDAALSVIGMLTPEERKQLADDLRVRDDRGKARAQ